MELDYYREFLELTRTLNFREAAGNLCISPSALSKHIRALEQHYQTTLLTRDRRHVALTASGTLLREHARAICAAYDESLSDMAAARNNRPLIMAGLVQNTEEEKMVLQVMQETSRRNIERRVRIHAVAGFDIKEEVAALKNGQHNCFVFYELSSRIDDPEIEIAHLCTVPLDIVVSSKSALAKKDSVSLSDVVGGTFIHLAGPQFSPIWYCIEAKLNEAGVPHTIRPIPTTSVYDYYSMELGDSLLVAPHRGSMEPYAANPQMEAKLLAVDAEGFALKLEVAYLRADKDPSLKTLIESLQSCYRSSVEE